MTFRRLLRFVVGVWDAIQRVSVPVFVADPELPRLGPKGGGPTYYLAIFCRKLHKQGMHSSRMHTAHSSSHLLEGCLPQCMLGYTPWPGASQAWGWTQPPPHVWAWTPSWPDPQTSPLGLGLDPPDQTPQPPPGPGPRHPHPWTDRQV